MGFNLKHTDALLLFVSQMDTTEISTDYLKITHTIVYLANRNSH